LQFTANFRLPDPYRFFWLKTENSLDTFSQEKSHDGRVKSPLSALIVWYLSWLAPKPKQASFLAAPLTLPSPARGEG
jgi:hypothetical protein